jgi:hypothetical protein
MWYCDRCKEHVQAAVQRQLWRAGDVLVLQLARMRHFGTQRRKVGESAIDLALLLWCVRSVWRLLPGAVFGAAFYGAL